MSRSRRKYLAPDHGKKGRFPRHHKKFDIDITDEDVDSPSRMSMRKPHVLAVPYDEDCRGVAVDISKMTRVLRKQVGRPWNEVQGEFLREYDSRTFEGYTIREWLDYIVEHNVIIHKDGSITDARGLCLGYFWNDLYIHPETGILCLSPYEQIKYHHTTPQTVFKLDSTLYHQHEGLWYRVEMKLFQKKKHWWGHDYEYNLLTPIDAFLKFSWALSSRRRDRWAYREKYGFDPKGCAWYCIWKQSANSKEIARLKTKYFSDKKAA